MKVDIINTTKRLYFMIIIISARYVRKNAHKIIFEYSLYFDIGLSASQNIMCTSDIILAKIIIKLRLFSL